MNPNYKLTRKMRAEIQAEEDRLIFQALDNVAPVLVCDVKGHSEFGNLLHKCQEPECIVRMIHES